MLAVLCAAARDPLLRCTADVVREVPPPGTVDSEAFREAVAASFPGRFAHGVLARIARNVASSWTQSGHLRGRVNKVHMPARATPASAAYALYLGHLGGDTGPSLFHTQWVALLDGTESEVRSLAAAASRLGWINYRSAAEMTEVTFRHLDGLAAAAEAVEA